MQNIREKLKANILNILSYAIHIQSRFFDYLSDKGANSSEYSSLSPTENAENADIYFHSLDWALNNSSAIQNIAIAGPYGSGKSSVIKTYQKKNKHDKRFRFLNISLATFEKNNNKKEDLLRLIELSILQQLFYHEDEKHIPNSRFKKIKKNNFYNLWILALLIAAYLSSIIYLFKPEYLHSIIPINIPLQIIELLNTLPTNNMFITIFLLGTVFLIYFLVTIFKNIEVKRLSLNSAEIEIDPKISKSILNHHIDEILYFFEATKYNVVIIEDLDRFEQTEVFTKLREINLLLNNSEKINRDIIFIYAIRDDVFIENDRTKFFDFIIPIIPVINSSNSNEKILKLVKQNGYKFSQQIIEDLANFVEDMRLLLNIINEYSVYSKNLDQSLDQDKLLAMVVYKNLFPEDFSKLNNNKGILFSILSKKNDVIERKKHDIDEQIESLEVQIDNLEGVRLKNVAELRVIYLNKIIEKILQTNPSNSFRGFFINNAEITLQQAKDDQNFLYFKDNLNLVQYLFNGGNRNTIAFSFEEVCNEVDPNLDYGERERLILSRNNKEVENLKKKVTDFEHTKNELQKMKLMSLISEEEIKIDDNGIEDEKQNQLIGILLRSGYIDEDYSDYITIFYEGSITKSDNKFLNNVKTQRLLSPDHKLNKVENLVNKIRLHDFEKKYVLNYSLLDFLLTNDGFEEQKSRIFNQFSKNSDENFKFINDFINTTQNIDSFISRLCKSWPEIWDYIENESKLTDQQKTRYMKLIIEHAELVDIKLVFANHIDSISGKSDFLSIIDNSKKIKGVIESLNVKFKNVDQLSPKELIDFIYEKNFYDLNIAMLSFMLKHKGYFNQNDFDTKNFYCIKNSNQEKLIDYVHSYINDYVSNIYLDLKSNTEDPNEILEDLYNNEDLQLKYKVKIIAQVNTKINDISRITNLEIQNELLKQSKILANWENMYNIYSSNENLFTEDHLAYLNVDEFSNQLSNQSIKQENESFINSLLSQDSIKDENYSLLLESIPANTVFANFLELSYEKVESLIRRNFIKLSQENFNNLVNNFENGLEVKLIEKNQSEFINNLSNYNLNKTTILNILKSKIVDINIKNQLISGIDIQIILDNLDILNEIGELLSEHRELKTSKQIIITALTKSQITIEEKVNIFNLNKELLDHSDINNVLLEWGKPYSELTINGKRPSLLKSTYNSELVGYLKESNFISSFKETNNKIQVSTFNKPRVSR